LLVESVEESEIKVYRDTEPIRACPPSISKNKKYIKKRQGTVGFLRDHKGITILMRKQSRYPTKKASRGRAIERKSSSPVRASEKNPFCRKRILSGEPQEEISADGGGVKNRRGRKGEREEKVSPRSRAKDLENEMGHQGGTKER